MTLFLSKKKWRTELSILSGVEIKCSEKCVHGILRLFFCCCSSVGSEAETASLGAHSAEQECNDQLKEHSNTPDAEESFL